jgi:hypothetical protein
VDNSKLLYMFFEFLIMYLHTGKSVYKCIIKEFNKVVLFFIGAKDEKYYDKN